MKKFNPNKNIIILLIAVIVVVTLISVTAAKRANEGKPNLLQAIGNDATAVVDKVISAPVRVIRGGVDSVSNLLATYEENQHLKEKIDSYDELSQENANKEKEIADLKKELSLSDTLTSYDKVVSTVITRSPDTWQDMLVVDKGTSDGIKANMAVMSQKGLIGRIIEANARSSKVELLTTANQSSNQFPVKISSAGQDSYGVLKGYDTKKQALIVSQVTGTAEIKKDDVVQTSGLGGNSPANLAVGTVESVAKDSMGLERVVYVKPYADMYDISYATIIKRLAEVGE